MDSRDEGDSVREEPRAERAVSAPEHPLSPAGLRARQEYTERYRAAVDAAYAAAGFRAGDGRPADAEALKAARPDMAERYPARYARSPDPPPEVDGPGVHPSRWIEDIYPGRHRRERPNNCGECSRAVDNTYHGIPATAADLANRRVGGERPAVMAEWAGQTPQAASMAEIGRRLCELGPGSSAIVGFDRYDDPGHWFNAVNHAGTVLAVDGQSARFEKWPPSKDGLGFDESVMRYSDAIFFTADGKVVPNDHT